MDPSGSSTGAGAGSGTGAGSSVDRARDPNPFGLGKSCIRIQKKSDTQQLYLTYSASDKTGPQFDEKTARKPAPKTA